MPQWSAVTRSHVLAAIAEYDQLGSTEFLRRHGFRRAHSYMLWHNGQEYDSKAILGVAYLHATGRPATWDEFSGGKDGAAKVLRERGFDVVAQESVATPRSRKTAASKGKTAPAPTSVNVCPGCNMAVPASGVCDYCN